MSFVYGSYSRFPFVWVAQYLYAKELIIMPIWAFIKLSNEELPDPGTDENDVIMLFNTARYVFWFFKLIIPIFEK